MRTYEMTTFEEVNFEMVEMLRRVETLNVNIIRDIEPVTNIAATLSQIANDINTLKMQMNGIESRYTQREEKHAQLVSVVDQELLLPVSEKAVKLEEGYLDSLFGVKIKASVSAQSRFTSLVAGLLNDEKLGKIDDNSIVYFYEYNDTPTGLPYLAFSQLMSRYKDYCQYIESQY